MKRLIFFLLLALYNSASFSAVYKCEQSNGKIEYQSSACTNGLNISNKVTQSNSSISNTSQNKLKEAKKCTGKEVRLNFSDMPINSTLSVLADFSGNKLVIDPSVKGSGSFNYDCVPCDSVLQDIASRYNLSIILENGTIFVRKK